MTETKFIVATSSSEGAWCTDRSSTLSLINSHIASHKARQGVGRPWRQQAHSTPVTHRPRKIASACGNVRSYTTDPSWQIHGQTSKASHGQCSWSLEDLNEAFNACQGEKKEGSSDSSLSPLTHASSNVSEVSDNIRMDQIQVFQTSDRFTPPPARYELSLPQGYRPNAFFVTELNGINGAYKKKNPTGKKHRLSITQSLQKKPPGYPGHCLQQICTTLDPFLQLAVEVSERERTLLHYYLIEGRYAVFGAKPESDYCPATHVVRRGALTKSPAFVLTHIAVAEYLWSQKCGSDVSAGFFQRRAEAYKEVSRLIQDPNAAFDDQICGLITLQHAEFIVIRSDLQTVHLVAMNEFVERKGGIQCFLDAKSPGLTIIEPKFYTVQFMFAGHHQLANEQLDKISGRFITDFTRIRNWNLKTWRSRGELEKNDSKQDSGEDCELRKFGDHLHYLADKHLGNQIEPYFLSAGTFLFLCNMCITLVDLDLKLAQARRFLLSVHKSLQLIAQTSYQLRLAVAALLVPYLRCTSQSSNIAVPSFPQALRTNLPNDFNLEVRMCESAVNTMRLFHSLSPESQVYLGRTLLQSLIAVMGFSNEEPLRNFAFEDLRLEFLRTEAEQKVERKVP